MNIENNINEIQLAITHLEQTYQRHGEVTLLAVSKTKPLTAVKTAYEAGLRTFGENYVQEGVQKIIDSQQAPWAHETITWHFIGPLQANKSRPVAEHFDWVHTIDRAKIARRLNEQRPKNCAPLNVCIQINISGEASKSGIGLSELPELANYIQTLPHLKLRGLMTIGTPGKAQAEFPKMQQAFHRLQNRHPDIDTLSMGMTSDMDIAIQYGATLVRIGTAIFGQRDYSHFNS